MIMMMIMVIKMIVDDDDDDDVRCSPSTHRIEYSQEK